jgi:hypothetical protein
MAIDRVSNLKDCRGFVIKFVRVKINLRKRILIWFVIKVHNINVKQRVNKRERERVGY